MDTNLGDSISSSDQHAKIPTRGFLSEPMSGIEGQVSKFALLTKNFLPGLASGKATELRLFASDESKTFCFLTSALKNPHSGIFIWADVRNRTGDLRLTMALLYQLSYIGKWEEIWKLVYIFASNAVDERFLLHRQYFLVPEEDTRYSFENKPSLYYDDGDVHKPS